MNYADLLKKNGVKPEETTKKIQSLINELLGIEKAIPMAQEQLKDNALSAGKRKKLTTDLKAAQEALPELDEALCSAIEAWLPRREEFAKKAKALLESKAAKRTASAAPADAGSAAPAGTSAPKNGPAENKAAPAPAGSSSAGNGQQAPSQKKKGGFGWGWIIGGVVVFVGAIVGVNLANKAK